MNIIEGISKEIRELIEARTRIEAEIKTLAKARTVLIPIINGPTQPETIAALPERSTPKPRDAPEKSPKKFLRKEYRGLHVIDAVRQLLNGDWVHTHGRTFRERDVSRSIFTYAPGMDLNRCHGACATSVIALADLGICIRVEPGLYAMNNARSDL